MPEGGPNNKFAGSEQLPVHHDEQYPIPTLRERHGDAPFGPIQKIILDSEQRAMRQEEVPTAQINFEQIRKQTLHVQCHQKRRMGECCCQSCTRGTTLRSAC